MYRLKKKKATCDPPELTEEQITGTGQYATLNVQAGLDDVTLTQIKTLFLRA